MGDRQAMVMRLAGGLFLFSTILMLLARNWILAIVFGMIALRTIMVTADRTP